jgi:homoserine dehydrogenase
MRAPYRVGLLGLGNVGGALAGRLAEDADWIAPAAGRPVVLEGIAVARPRGRKAPAPLIPAEELLRRAELDAVIELIGGLEPAHTYINMALRSGRHLRGARRAGFSRCAPGKPGRSTGGNGDAHRTANPVSGSVMTSAGCRATLE